MLSLKSVFTLNNACRCAKEHREQHILFRSRCRGFLSGSAVLLCLFFLTAVLWSSPITASAGNLKVVDEGVDGNITWQIVLHEQNEFGVYPRELVLSGNGPMKDYSHPNHGCPGDVLTPWFTFPNGWNGTQDNDKGFLGSKYGFLFETITIKNGITRIGNYAFQGCSFATSVNAFRASRIEIPSSVTSLGDCAFGSIGKYTTTVAVPDSVQSFGDNVFGSKGYAVVECSAASKALEYAVNNGYAVKVTDLAASLNKTSLTLKKGSTSQLRVTANVPSMTPRYFSSDPSVAEVSETGKITAKSSGTATVSVSLGGKTLTCTVTVADRYKVTYVLGGGTNSSLNPKTYTEGTTVALKNPTRKKYLFDGWYTLRRASTGSKGKTVYTFSNKISRLSPATASGDITLYASWTKVTLNKASSLNLKNTASKKMTVTWGKVANAGGYQVQISRKSSFSSIAGEKSTTSRKIVFSNLKKGSNYYVRVRAWRKDSTGSKVYGSWSAVKKP